MISIQNLVKSLLLYLQQTVSFAQLCRIIRHIKAGSSLKSALIFPYRNGKSEDREKTIACTTTLPGACWFGGGSWHRSRSSCWGWRWPAWTWCRTSLWGIGDRALTRGWSWWLLTIFARWWVSYSPILTQYTASSSRNTQLSQLDLVIGLSCYFEANFEIITVCYFLVYFLSVIFSTLFPNMQTRKYLFPEIML